MSESVSGRVVKLLAPFLVASDDLSDPRYRGGSISMVSVGREIGVHDTELLKQITHVLTTLHDLERDPGTEEIVLVRVTPKGREAARRLRQ